LLLDDLQRSSGTLKALATRYGLQLRDLAAWADEPENAGALRSLRALADTRAALVVSRSRVTAALNLLRIASDKENSETARKACVDLFNLRMPEIEAPAPAKQGGPPHADAAVRSLLAKLAAGSGAPS
jgi:hypothetical protein